DLPHVDLRQHDLPVQRRERPRIAAGHRAGEAPELAGLRPIDRPEAVLTAEARGGPARRAESDVQVDLHPEVRAEQHRAIDAVAVFAPTVSHTNRSPPAGPLRRPSTTGR